MSALQIFNIVGLITVPLYLIGGVYYATFYQDYKRDKKKREEAQHLSKF